MINVETTIVSQTYITDNFKNVKKQGLQMIVKNKLFFSAHIRYIQNNSKPNGVITNAELLKISIKLYMLPESEIKIVTQKQNVVSLLILKFWMLSHQNNLPSVQMMENSNSKTISLNYQRIYILDAFSHDRKPSMHVIPKIVEDLL